MSARIPSTPPPGGHDGPVESADAFFASVVGTCIHCGAATTFSGIGGERLCWPPCPFYVAHLRASLSDPDVAEGAAALLDMAGIRGGIG